MPILMTLWIGNCAVLESSSQWQVNKHFSCWELLGLQQIVVAGRKAAN